MTCKPNEPPKLPRSPILRDFYQLPHQDYGAGPPYQPIGDDDSLSSAVDLLRKAHDDLLSAHRERVSAAGTALNGWQGPAAHSFLFQLNDARPGKVLDEIAAPVKDLR